MGGGRWRWGVRVLLSALLLVASVVGGPTGAGPPASAAVTDGFVPGVAGPADAALASLAARRSAGDGRLSGQIVGGAPVASARWPGTVSLNLRAAYDDGDDRWGHLCGGTVVSARWVLTAAHCVTFEPGVDHATLPPGLLEVVAGRARLSSTEGSRIPVDEILVTTGWAGYDLDHDLALLHLAAPAPVPAVRLLGPGNAAALPPATGTTPPTDVGVRAVGWGLTTPDGSGLPSEVLREIAVPLWSASSCAAAVPGFDPATSVCAGPTAGMPDADTCFGDSGGPLMRRDGGTGTWGQVGIVSYAVVAPGTPACGMAGRPTVYTSVAAFAAAITEVTGAPFAPDAPVVEAPARRIAGATRYDTNVAAVGQAWPDGAAHVVLVTGAAYADALAGSPVAAALGGPLLLTAPDALPAPVAGELRRLAPRTVTVLGGTAAVDDAVVAQVEHLTGAIATRLEGASRYGTAVAGTRHVFDAGVDDLWLATGDGFADALTGAVAAASQGAPLLLVPSTLDAGALPPALAAELQRLAPGRVHLLGGEVAIDDAVAAAVGALLPGATVERRAGADRYGTAAAVAAALGDAPEQVYLSTGADHPDALSAGVLAATSPGPLLLTRPRALPAGVGELINRLAPREVVVLGGDAVVGWEVLASFGR